MGQYNNSVVLKFDTKATGNAGSGKPITVRVGDGKGTGTGNLASIYGNDGQPIENPLNTDNNGNYTFIADAGVYDIIIDEYLGDEFKIIIPNEELPLQGTLSSTSNSIDLATIYNVVDGSNATSALVDAFTKYDSISLKGLAGIYIDDNTDLSINRKCRVLSLDDASLKVGASQVILSSIGDSLDFTLDIANGQLTGDGKHAELAVNTGVNTNQLTIVGDGGFVVGDRICSSFDNTYLRNSTSNGAVNTITDIIDNGDSTFTITTDFDFLRRPNGPSTGSVSFVQSTSKLRLARSEFPGCERCEVNQNIIVTDTTNNNGTYKITSVIVDPTIVELVLDATLTLEAAPAATIDFRGDYPIPAGAYVTNADFQKNGLSFYGSGDFTIKADSGNETAIRNFKGYIATCIDSERETGTRRGTFTLDGVNWSESFLDGFKVHKQNLTVTRTTNKKTLEPGKQGVLFDGNENSFVDINNNDWDRQNKDQDILWYSSTDSNTLVLTGNVSCKNNKFASSITSLPYGGTPDLFGRGRLTFDKGAFHVFAPFFTAGVKGGVFESEGNEVKDYSRAFVSSTRGAKDTFEFTKISGADDYMECDFSLIFETGISNTEASRKRHITVTNSTVGGSQETLNLGSLTTYYDCDIFTTREMLEAQGDVDFVGLTYSVINGGSVRGRFRQSGSIAKFTKVRLPYAPDQDAGYQVPLLANTYINDDLNFIFETPEVNLDGYQDINNWIGVQLVASNPGSPKFRFQFERLNLDCEFGGRDFNEGQFYANIRAERIDTNPYGINGLMLHRLPKGSILHGDSDNSKRENVSTARLSMTSTIDGTITPVTSFTVDGNVPFGMTHLAVVRENPDSDQNNSILFYRLDASSWNSSTVTLAGNDEITYEALAGSLVAFYTFVDVTDGHRGIRAIPDANYTASVYDGGKTLRIDNSTVRFITIPSGIEDGSMLHFLTQSSTLNLTIPSGWTSVGTMSVPLNERTGSFQFDAVNKIVYKV